MPRTILLVAASVLLMTGRAANARVGELEVRAGNNGAPCFTVSAREEQRSGAPQFQSIGVSDAGGGAMWTMAMPSGRTFALAYYMCVPYGGRPPVLPQTPAAVLQRGRAYEVLVHAQPARRGAPRQYRARFCLAGTAQEGRIAMLDAGRASCPR